MKKLLFAIVMIVVAGQGFAQEATSAKKEKVTPLIRLKLTKPYGKRFSRKRI